MNLLNNPFYKYGMLAFLSLLFIGSFLAFGINHLIMFRDGVVLLGVFGLIFIHLAGAFIKDSRGKTMCMIIGFIASIISCVLVITHL